MKMQLIVSSQITDDQNLVRPCLKQYYVHVYLYLISIFSPSKQNTKLQFQPYFWSKRNLSAKKNGTITLMGPNQGGLWKSPMRGRCLKKKPKCRNKLMVTIKSLWQWFHVPFPCLWSVRGHKNFSRNWPQILGWQRREQCTSLCNN